MKALRFQELRAQLHAHYQKQTLSCSLVAQGIPRGAITAICGVGKTELAVQLITEHPALRVAWIEEQLSIFPFALLQRGIGLDRVLFVDAGPELAWSLLQVLKAQIFPVVVVYAERLDLQTLRRVQLAAETADAATLWLTGEPQDLWPVSLQLRAHRLGGELKVTALRSGFR